MLVDKEIPQGLVGCISRGEHADDVRILSKLIMLKDGKHSRVTRPSLIGEYEEDEVKQSD